MHRSYKQGSFIVQVEQEEIRRFNATSYTPPPLLPSYPQPITPLVGRRELEMLNTSTLLPLILGIKDKSAVWFQQELHLSKRDSDDLAKMILDWEGSDDTAQDLLDVVPHDAMPQAGIKGKS
jgi:hypothetical protein